jgi:hypothetical protein
MNYSSARKVDAPEGDAPRNYAGLTEAAMYTGRTRDRQTAELASKPEAQLRTPEQQAADYYLALHHQREAEAEAERQRRVASGKIVDAQQRRIAEAIAEAKARKSEDGR